MGLRASYFKKVFIFNFEARTSRGKMPDKTSWFIKLWDDRDPNVVGIGECGPLPGLSMDDVPEFESVLEGLVHSTIDLPAPKDANGVSPETWLLGIYSLIPPHFPSIVFGLETACLDLFHGGTRVIFKNNFLLGQRIPINGLVWMGDLDFMMHQVHEKIKHGFTCVKLKVGGLDFDQECSALQGIRKAYAEDKITLRLDANGAFEPHDALQKLQMLSKYGIHSIEQPVKQGQHVMADLCRTSPIPIALDEELIGFESDDSKKKLLTSIQPQYIILKPTLHGGLSGCARWIALAENFKIGWWITSALESNIGLNAICQFTANYPVTTPQGLGTGSIYQSNFNSPLRVNEGHIYLDDSASWTIDTSN